jgi:CO/xanthine dehydrogenase Mo-binding subunit
VAAGPPNANVIDSWVAIHADNTATIAFGKIDITGAPTGLLMIAAEELDLTIQQVSWAPWNTDVSPNQGFTAGSNSISNGGPQVRQAAAEARVVLLGLAAKQLGVPLSDLQVRAGVVSSKSDPSKTVTYGALLGDKPFTAPNTGRAPLKPVTEYRLVGKSVKRKDTEGKVRGTHPYVHQLRLPGMLHGRIVRPKGQGPYAVADKVLSIDESSIKNIKGAKVYRKGDFIGVVAANEQDAIQAATQLKVRWSESKTMPGSGNLWKHFREVKSAERYARNAGSVDKGLTAAAKTEAQSYSIYYQSHASFGPSCGVADVKPGKVDVWGASQAMYTSRSLVAGLLNVPQDTVTFHFAEGSGCYGKNLQDDAAIAAAMLSQLAGKPVRVQLTRDQEHGWDFYGPATLVDIRGAVDDKGLITAYDYVSYQQGWVSTEASDFHSGRPAPLGNFGGADIENAGSQYKITNHRCARPLGPERQQPAEGRLPAGPGGAAGPVRLRADDGRARGRGRDGLGRVPQAEHRELPLAGSARGGGTARRVGGARLRLGGRQGPDQEGPRDRDRRLREHLRGHRRRDRGRHCHGKIRAKHVYAAHDCGLVINPNTVGQQVEGCVVQGVSRALLEEVKFSKSRVTTLDWEAYPILRYKDAPEITYTLLNRPELRSSGAGEPATAPVAAAIANAFFDATGKRIRTMPMTPARVRRR